MSLMLHIEAAAHIFGTFSALESGRQWVLRVGDADFIGVLASALLKSNVGDRETKLVDLLFPADEDRRHVLEVLRDLAAAVFRPVAQGWCFRDEVVRQDEIQLRTSLPIGLLLSTFVADRNKRLGGAVVERLPRYRASWDGFLQAELNKGLADGHVHIGASIPFPALFLLAVDATHSLKDRPGEVFRVVSGEKKYRVDVILLAARIALEVLWGFLKDEERPNTFGEYVTNCSWIEPDLRHQLTEGRFWSAVAQDALHNPASDELPPSRLTVVDAFHRGEGVSLAEAFQTEFGVDDATDWAFRVFTELLEHHLANSRDEDYALQLTQLIRCLCLLHQAVTPSRSGLHDLVRHYRVQKKLRREVKMQPGALVTHGLQFLTRNGSLRKLELRSSVHAGSSGEKIRAPVLAAQCVDYLESYKEHLNGARLPMVVMPVTFSRRSDAQGSPNGAASDGSDLPCRWQFQHLWELMEQIAELFKKCPGMMRFFGIVDVAGKEDEMPNWIFHLLIEELENRISSMHLGGWPEEGFDLICTVHAGEDCASPLEGLRRIAEVLEHMPRGTRIGHGLALGWSASYRLEQSRQELLDDLTWALPSLEGTLKSQAEDELFQLGEQLYERHVDLPTLSRAYEWRFSPEKLRELGLFTAGPGELRDTSELEYNGVIHTQFLGAGNDDPHRVLARYLTDPHLDKTTCDLREPGLRSLVQAVYEAALPHLTDKIVARGTIVELCPTSNLVIAGIPAYEDHPVFALTPPVGEVAVTLNSDDPGIFHTTIEDEYAHVWKASASKIKIATHRQEWLAAIRRRGMAQFARNLDEPEIDIHAELTACIETLSSFARSRS